MASIPTSALSTAHLTTCTNTALDPPTPRQASLASLFGLMAQPLFSRVTLESPNVLKFVTGMSQGSKNLDGACYAGPDLIPPHANVNLTTPWAQAPLPDVDQTTRRHRGRSEVHVIDIRARV